MLRSLPLALLLAFFIVDTYAPLLGMTQVSVQVWDEGLWARALVALGLIALASHIAFGWPWPPRR